MSWVLTLLSFQRDVALHSTELWTILIASSHNPFVRSRHDPQLPFLMNSSGGDPKTAMMLLDISRNGTWLQSPAATTRGRVPGFGAWREFTACRKAIYLCLKYQLVHLSKKTAARLPNPEKELLTELLLVWFFVIFFGFTSTLATFFFADVTWQDCSLPPWLVNPTHFCLIFCLSFCCFLIGDSLLLVAVKLITRFQKQDQWRLNNFRLYVISTKTIGSNICVDIHVRIYVLNTSKYI